MNSDTHQDNPSSTGTDNLHKKADQKPQPAKINLNLQQWTSLLHEDLQYSVFKEFQIYSLLFPASLNTQTDLKLQSWTSETSQTIQEAVPPPTMEETQGTKAKTDTESTEEIRKTGTDEATPNKVQTDATNRETETIPALTDQETDQTITEDKINSILPRTGKTFARTLTTDEGTTKTPLGTGTREVKAETEDQTGIPRIVSVRTAETDSMTGTNVNGKEHHQIGLMTDPQGTDASHPEGTTRHPTRRTVRTEIGAENGTPTGQVQPPTTELTTIENPVWL